MDLTNFHQLHFIGIGGMGMRALAQVMLSRGIGVSGSDLSDSPALEQFRKEGARIYIGHRPGQADHAEGVVISSAISADNPELQDAREKGIPVFTDQICWRLSSPAAGAWRWPEPTGNPPLRP